MPTAISLFSGCGGSDLGLRAAGFDVLLANDVLPYARDVHERNLGGVHFHLGDVKELTKFPEADVLIGCYPCQGFSQAGVRDPSRSVNFLYREFDRVLRTVKPKAFIVENVSGMVRSSNSHLHANQLTRFRFAGYRVKCQLLDARSFGVPQDRIRLFFVGIRSDLDAEYEFPTPTHSLDANDEGLPSCPTIRDAIGDLPLWPEGEYDDQEFHWYYLSRNRYRGWDDQARTVVAKSRHASLHPVSPRLNRIHTDKWVFENNGPARRFSFREAARLQGFPSDFAFPETAGLAMKYRVVGNAVPPPLFAAVAKAIPDFW
jgi:DNA (cytosine-5)-methyltransferase 1